MINKNTWLDHRINRCWQWLMNRYNLDLNIADLHLSFRFRGKREIDSPYCNIIWDDQHDIVDAYIHIIEDREWWKTYRRKTAWVQAPMMQVGSKAGVEFQLIHELTHVIEFHLGQDLGEVKPTQNEILFAFDQYYSYFKQCKPLIDKRKLPQNYARRTRPIKCVI